MDSLIKDALEVMMSVLLCLEALKHQYPPPDSSYHIRQKKPYQVEMENKQQKTATLIKKTELPSKLL